MFLFHEHVVCTCMCLYICIYKCMCIPSIHIHMYLWAMYHQSIYDGFHRQNLSHTLHPSTSPGPHVYRWVCTSTEMQGVHWPGEHMTNNDTMYVYLYIYISYTHMIYLKHVFYRIHVFVLSSIYIYMHLYTHILSSYVYIYIFAKCK